MGATCWRTWYGTAEMESFFSHANLSVSNWFQAYEDNNHSASKQFEKFQVFDEIKIELLKDTVIELSPSPSSINFIDGISITQTPETSNSNPNPNPTELKSETEGMNDDKPLDLSMRKPSKVIYVMDSDDEAEPIIIDSDDDHDDHDDNKEHLQKTLNLNMM